MTTAHAGDCRVMTTGDAHLTETINDVADTLLHDDERAALRAVIDEAIVRSVARRVRDGIATVLTTGRRYVDECRRQSYPGRARPEELDRFHQMFPDD